VPEADGVLSHASTRGEDVTERYESGPAHAEPSPLASAAINERGIGLRE
jgi:hypothetical protein